MRLSEFDRAVKAEFGARGGTLVHDLLLSGIGYRSATQALADGVDAREVWLALCAEAEVPPNRWHGVGRIEPPRR